MVAISSVSQAATAASSSSNPVLRSGATGASVTKLQKALTAKGYKVTADGAFGPKTLAAVKAFQKARGLAVDGIVGPATWRALNATTAAASTPTSPNMPVLKSGSKGANVTLLQKTLTAKGYKLTADGAFGPATLAAVKAFQRAKGLTADGVVGPKTWGALGVSKPAATPAPTSPNMPVLKSGSSGANVTLLQKTLTAKGYKLTADGAFGPATLAAVKAFQRAKGLTADGVVGPKTWGALGVSKPAVESGTLVTGYVNGRAQSIRVTSVGNGQRMRTDAAAKFNAMKAAAAKAGINLYAVSGFRTNSEQQYLYNLYRQGRGNLAAPPGYSNHQGGIAVDINTGPYSSAAYRWLAANGRKYGFVNDVSGEPWHWTYRG